MTRLLAFLLYIAVAGLLLVVVMGVAPGNQVSIPGVYVGLAFVAAGSLYALLARLEGTGRGIVPDAVAERYGPRARQAFVALLAAAVFGSMVHQAGPVFKFAGIELREVKWRLWEWYIEDAAISFAYARNWAMGDGLVAFPGGERIEGYSNPTWVALMALWYLVGVDGFLSSKLMSMAMGGATILMSWLIAREVLEDRDGPGTLVAPVALACMPTFAFWNAAGLENPIVNLCMAGGIWRVIVESRRGGFPWSSVWFLVLAISRPEAIMYGAWGGFVAMAASLLGGRGLKSTLQWLVTFFVPFGVYHAVRYDYFAYAFPNTYYAKLGDKEFKPFAWMARGWKYIRGWAWDTGTGWFVWIPLAGLVGLRGARRWLVPLATLALAFLFLYPNAEATAEWSWWPADLPNPTWWNEARVWLLMGLALALPVASLRDRRAVGRVLAWGMILISLFFCVRSSGDWMKGYRWMSFIMVPGVLLFAAGVEELADLFQRTLGRRAAPGWSTPGWLVATVLVIGVMPGWFMHSDWFFGKRETGPFSVQRRAQYTEWLMDRMFVRDQLVRNLDVDMGAHLYWSPHQMVDMAGLVDVSIAHHVYKDRSFTKEYVFDEKKPAVAHVHGGWASNSRIPTFAEWKRDYIDVPGFPVSGRTNHVGNHMRRDVFMSPTWTGAQGRAVSFESGVTLAGFDVPSPEISQGKALYIEVGVQYRQLDDKEDFRVLAFLSNADGQLESFDVPVGYDWLPPSEWRIGEVCTVRIAPPTSGDLPPGLYDLGFVVLGADGRVIPVTSSPDGANALPARAVIGGRDGVSPRFMVGEVRFPDVVRIGEAGTGEVAAAADRERALALAEDGACADAEASWRKAWQHMPRADAWLDEQRPAVAEAMARCWAGLADGQTDPSAAVGFLESARAWNHREPLLIAVGQRVGAVLQTEGEQAREREDWEAAYRAFDGAVRANPSLSWARRYAEEVRDKRLGIDPDSVEQARVEREEAARARAEAVDAAKGEPDADEEAGGDGEP